MVVQKRTPFLCCYICPCELNPRTRVNYIVPMSLSPTSSELTCTSYSCVLFLCLSLVLKGQNIFNCKLKIYKKEVSHLGLNLFRIICRIVVRNLRLRLIGNNFFKGVLSFQLKRSHHFRVPFIICNLSLKSSLLSWASFDISFFISIPIPKKSSKTMSKKSFPPPPTQ